jgi:hypothetical protein
MPDKASTAIASPARDGVNMREKPKPGWTRWVLPSIADIFFLVLIGLLAFAPASAALLGDADTGWHIRNGELILATHAVPHTDPFSYTKAGQPWYAWEWLYDVVIAIVHHFGGLNGVVLFTAVVIALTFALLFRFVLRRSGNFAVAVGLTLVAASAAQIHMLARPHVLSWLFTLLWVEALYCYEEGKRSALLWLPPLMLLWVNVHGGFILGLVLLVLFGCGRLWKRWTKTGAGEDRRIAPLAITFGICLATTLLTPYGYKLHVHIYQYLSNHFLMNSINEFMSPDFHAVGFGYFEFFVLLTVFALGVAYERLAATDLLLILFSLHAALYSARNIPLSAILMSVATAPLWAGILSRDGIRRRDPRWLGSLLQAVQDISANMAALEKQFRGHVLALVALAASTVIVLNGGRVGSAQLMSAHFNEKTFPVKAAEFIRTSGIHDHMFNSDNWSGYLIYKLYPGTKVFFDDRHDFYGEAFIREYLQAAAATRKWREPLDKYQVQWVLAGADSPLAAVLKESKDWRVAYEDGLAIVFARVGR